MYRQKCYAVFERVYENPRGIQVLPSRARPCSGGSGVLIQYANGAWPSPCAMALEDNDLDVLAKSVDEAKEPLS